jgi:hypothetical protein
MTRISNTSPGGILPARVPHERSDLSHWRKRLGDKLELLLAESLRRIKAVRFESYLSHHPCSVPRFRRASV